MPPLVSVIIPSHNEERHIANAIKSISDQTYDKIELMLIDDGSTDKTNKNSAIGLKNYVFSNDRTVSSIAGIFGSAAKTRNEGAKYAAGEILIFHDADCVADKDMVKNVVKGIELGFDGVATKTMVIKPKTLIERAIKAERSIGWDMRQDKAVDIHKGSPVLVANMRKECFDKLGGFDEKIFYFEDQNLTDRFFDMGFKAYFDPTVIEYHNDPSTLKEQIDQSMSNGKGIRTLLKRGNFRSLLIPLYPFVFLVGIISFLIGNYLLSAILWSPMLCLFLLLMEKEDDLIGIVTFLPLFLFRNIFKLVGLIKG